MEKNTLSSVSDWLFQNKATLPVYDVAYLMTGKDMADVESGMIQEGLAGIAWRGAACVVASGNKRSFNTGMGEDMGAYYVGVMTAAHEIAHNLGSPHDGKDGAEACSWDDGYIMSYIPGKANKLFFSSCSQKLMKEYMASDEAACLQSTQVGEKIPLSSKLPGELVSMDEQCQKQTGKSDAYASKSVSEDSLCVQLVCQWQVKVGYSIWTYTQSTGRPAAEGSACRSGGVCTNGSCQYWCLRVEDLHDSTSFPLSSISPLLSSLPPPLPLLLLSLLSPLPLPPLSFPFSPPSCFFYSLFPLSSFRSSPLLSSTPLISLSFSLPLSHVSLQLFLLISPPPLSPLLSSPSFLSFLSFYVLSPFLLHLISSTYSSHSTFLFRLLPIPFTLLLSSLHSLFRRSPFLLPISLLPSPLPLPPFLRSISLERTSWLIASYNLPPPLPIRLPSSLPSLPSPHSPPFLPSLPSSSPHSPPFSFSPPPSPHSPPFLPLLLSSFASFPPSLPPPSPPSSFPPPPPLSFASFPPSSPPSLHSPPSSFPSLSPHSI
ncbi:hypothetical protein C7M84_017146 [Penaeus vannamei]|uniref:Peptidase M12B domain-containing protein n=1 Tax=Penaeus vannamei TaxID=6689 RepID=A0A3R7LWC4_PENVA|nr:hypothetical protein C7M84_017146 [Penaeus vannamei]